MINQSSRRRKLMMRNYKNMGKKKKTILLSVSKRAWRLLRSALVFVRKGGAFKRSLLLALKLSGAGQHNNRLHYFEREFSFNETPSFHLKLHRRRPHMIPCINPPHAAFYYSEDDEDASCTAAINVVVFNGCNADHDHDHNLIIEEDYKIQLEGKGKGEEEGAATDDEQDQIDSKAEEFIAKFYEGMKFQRQLSLIQYNEMLLRSIS